MKKDRNPTASRDRSVPPRPSPGRVTRLLAAWGRGDPAIEGPVFEALSARLRRLAGREMRRERRGGALQPTALVHEAYLKLRNQRRASWRSRTHFLAVAAEQMRRHLLDRARRRLAAKRGGGRVRVTLSEDWADPVAARDLDRVELRRAIETLSEQYPRAGRVVALRFLEGLTVEETGRRLDISEATVKGDWTLARAWLVRELTRDPSADELGERRDDGRLE